MNSNNDREIWVYQETTISFTEMCSYCQISETALIELLEHGLFEPADLPIKDMSFDAEMLARLKSAQRLQRDLGINIPGVVLVMELLDTVQTLEKKLRLLESHIK